ncbi:amidohydrolase family protein [Actinomadura keratinilytica]
MIIDIHGHYTTAPAPLGRWREAQTAALADPVRAPDPAGPVISDDQIRESVETNQLRLMDERGIDVTVFSPRASFMAHHVGDFATSAAWSRICNDLCHRVSELYPDRFAPARCSRSHPARTRPPRSRRSSGPSGSWARSPSTSTPTRAAATGPLRR